jgi:phosphoribosylaminoimidazolecarboxamide formyltransferase / IMP cyclohydrolase
MSTSHSRIALISVTNKNGVIEFARGLKELSFTILSTGGTAKILRDEGISVTEVSDWTKSPEVLGGRVKTLHPMIHGGILADLTIPSHMADMTRMDWPKIDLVVVNLYDFAGEAKLKNLSLEKAIDFIDVGGPTMLRAAAKNHAYCLPVIDPADYHEVLAQYSQGSPSPTFRKSLAGKVFAATAAYDSMIANYFSGALGASPVAAPEPEAWAQERTLPLHLAGALRYGENSHQKAAFYSHGGHRPSGLAAAEILQGKELSYNNYIDLDAAAAIVADFSPLPAMTIVKHTNPCATAASSTFSPQQLFSAALRSDPKCAFGGIVASNIAIDEQAARAIIEIFLECVIAPDYSPMALQVFSTKKNLRVLKSNAVLESGRVHSAAVQWRSINGGLLAQTADAVSQNTAEWTCVTNAKPTVPMLADLKFAMTLCKHVKSNAILVASGLKSLGVGAGQMSRIDSARFALEKARELGHVVKGAVIASDAFFPFRDTVDIAAKFGISAIVQPGGSIRDQESVDAANEHGVVMMMTGTRHFKH